MRNKGTLTAAFSLACLEIRSRNEEGINLDCKQSLFSQSSLSWAGLQRAKWQRGKLQSPLSFLFFYFRSHRSISSLSWPSWGSARSLGLNSTQNMIYSLEVFYFLLYHNDTFYLFLNGFSMRVKYPILATSTSVNNCYLIIVFITLFVQLFLSL